MNVLHVIEVTGLKWLVNLKRVRSKRIPKTTMEGTVEGRRRKRKHSQQRPNTRRCTGQRILTGQNFFGMKDTYCTVEKINFRFQ